MKSVQISDRQKEWFPRWMDAFRRFQKQSPVAVLSADRDTVVALLVSLKESGRPAWSRMQTAQAIDMYRRRVLMSDDPVLEDVLARLSELTETEGNSARKSDPDSRAAGMPGPLDPNEPPVIRQRRTEIRLRHHSIRTEQAYVSWVQRFLQVNQFAWWLAACRCLLRDWQVTPWNTWTGDSTQRR